MKKLKALCITLVLLSPLLFVSGCKEELDNCLSAIHEKPLADQLDELQELHTPKALGEWADANPDSPYIHFARMSQEFLLWGETQRADTVVAYDRYLETFPKGIWKDVAIQRRAIASDDPEEMTRVLKTYPEGRQLRWARDHLEFKKVLELNTRYGFEKYLVDYPNGTYREHVEYYLAHKLYENRH